MYAGLYQSSLFLNSDFGCDDLIEVEEVSERVNCKLVRRYVTSCGRRLGGCLPFIFLLFAHSLVAVLNILASEYVRRMVQAQDTMSREREKLSFFVTAGCLVLWGGVTSVVTATLVGWGGHKIHQKMVKSVIFSRIDFFDQNPVGRIVNRFSKDLNVLNEVFPYITERILSLTFRIGSVFLIACMLLPWLAVPIIVAMLGVVVLRKKVLRVMVQAMKLETVSRSPLVSLLGSTLKGLTVIRAYGNGKLFQDKFEESVEVNARAFRTLYLLTNTFAFFLDSIASMICVVCIFVAFLSRNEHNALLLALALQLLNDISFQISNATRFTSVLETYFLSVARCLEYTNLPEEHPLLLPGELPHSINRVLAPG